MNVEDLNKVWEIKALKKSGEADARRTLDLIAKQVQPIMRKRKWKVKLLSEFCPTNPSLLGLNINHGAHVKLRLRRPNRDSEFFPFDMVLDTMLHELCHIQVGPHNAQFYKLWDELRVECEELISKGISGSGQGFDAPGRRLGGFTKHPPLSSLRQNAAEAAAKRARIGTLLPSGPRRLGGDGGLMAMLSPVQAAAMAAERRMQDDLWCGSTSSVEILNAIGSDKENSLLVNSGQSSKSSVGFPEVKDCLVLGDSCKSGDGAGSSRDAGTKSKSDSDEKSINGAEDEATWECGVCTLVNPMLAPICDACGNMKPKAVGAKFKTWACKFCTLENSNKLDKCSACEQWRYSNGPPVASHAPNYGT